MVLGAPFLYWVLILTHFFFPRVHNFSAQMCPTARQVLFAGKPSAGEESYRGTPINVTWLQSRAEFDTRGGGLPECAELLHLGLGQY